MSSQFGELLREFRFRTDMSLRSCSEALGVDPSNLSKMERGISAAPKPDILEKWATVFKLKPEELQKLKDVGAISRSEIPKDITDAAVVEALPVFFRAARDAVMDEAKLKQFVDQVRKLHTPD